MDPRISKSSSNNSRDSTSPVATREIKGMQIQLLEEILRNSESFADYDTRRATFRPRSLITTTTNRARRRGLLPAEVSRPTTPRYFPLAEISSPISDLNIPFPRLPCRVWIVNFVSIELILRN